MPVKTRTAKTPTGRTRTGSGPDRRPREQRRGARGRRAGDTRRARPPGPRGDEAVVRELLERYGTTYAAQAGIRLRDTPAPLYRLVVLAHLLSARIRAGVAVAAARALFAGGMGTARRMADAPWQRRVDALGEGGYRRYDERTSTQLGDGARLLLERCGGDVRRFREEGDPARALQELPGIGPTGAAIFLREVQDVWPESGPHFDGKALEGAERLGLPRSPGALARLAGGGGRAALAAALVRVALDREEAAEEVRAAARGTA